MGFFFPFLFSSLCSHLLPTPQASDKGLIEWQWPGDSCRGSVQLWSLSSKGQMQPAQGLCFAHSHGVGWAGSWAPTLNGDSEKSSQEHERVFWLQRKPAFGRSAANLSELPDSHEVKLCWGGLCAEQGQTWCLWEHKHKDFGKSSSMSA